MHVLLFFNPIAPIVPLVAQLIAWINIPLHNLGWSLIAFAALVRGVFWPLNNIQFKSMIGMQKVAPELKALQAKYKENPQQLQAESMALYKRHKVNPFAGCLPLIVQMPILFSVFYAVNNPVYKHLYVGAHWVWIGSAAAFATQHLQVLGIPVLATSLGVPDVILLVLYIASMYFSMRYSSMPATDPQQAQTQKMMALISPVMFAFIGFRAKWPSAMILYWLAYNVFTMAQTFYLLRKYHQPLSAIDSEHAITEDVVPVALKPGRNGSASVSAAAVAGTKASNRKRSRRSKR